MSWTNDERGNFACCRTGAVIVSGSAKGFVVGPGPLMRSRRMSSCSCFDVLPASSGPFK
jgi:hypothetical protein